MKRLLVLIFILVPSLSWAACTGSGQSWTCTPDYASINGCINGDGCSGIAAEATITVTAGDGTEDWDTTLAITYGVNLIGPGAANLTIKNTNESAGYIITYIPADYSNNHTFRLSGFKFDANNNFTLRLGNAPAGGFTENTKVRVDNNTFSDSSGTGQAGGAIINNGSLYGVVDNNTFTDFFYPIRHANGAGVDSWWANSPQNVFELGSYRYMYFEDNTFSGPIEVITDGQFSIRYVFRYNTMTTSLGGKTIQWFDMHGQQGNEVGQMAACFGAELYGNSLTATNNAGQSSVMFWQRSGQAVLAHNIIATSGSGAAYSAFSGLCVCPSAYAEQKIIHNTYVLNNRASVTGALRSGSGSADLDCLGRLSPAKGVDVFDDATTPGVTCGNSLPADCTQGQGYWLTSDTTLCTDLTGYTGAAPAKIITGTLYKCKTTGTPGTWGTASDGVYAPYTPYQYPHPLRGTGHSFSGGATHSWGSGATHTFQ